MVTRKNMKGVVGKNDFSLDKQNTVGVGLDFKRENVRTTEEIEKAIKKKKSE